MIILNLYFTTQYLQVDKDCLVVLDDVWSVDDAAVFDYLTGKCQLLITTRDADVVRGLPGSALCKLHPLEMDKSRKLLYQSADVISDEQTKFSANMQRIVAELLDQCEGLPLALSLVGSMLIDTRLEQDWQDILDDLKNADLEKLQLLFPSGAYPYGDVLAAMDVSFQRLEKEEQEKFLDFAIFPEDTNIPSDILELFWSSKTAGRTSCSNREGRRILNVLERKSLIIKGIQGGGEVGAERYGLYNIEIERLFLLKKLTYSKDDHSIHFNFSESSHTRSYIMLTCTDKGESQTGMMHAM